MASSTTYATVDRSTESVLVALARHLSAVWTVETIMVNRMPDTPEGNAACEAITAATSHIAQQITAVPATSFAGLGAKALALLYTRGDFPSRLEPEPSRLGETLEERLLASMAHDVAAMNEASGFVLIQQSRPGAPSTLVCGD